MVRLQTRFLIMVAPGAPAPGASHGPMSTWDIGGKESTMEWNMTEAIDRGTAWLDATVPDWASKVDVSTLDMASTTHCVAGQVFADRVPADQITAAHQVVLSPIRDGYDVMMSLVPDEAKKYPLGTADVYMGFTHVTVAEPDGFWYAERPEVADLREAWVERITERVSRG